MGFLCCRELLAPGESAPPGPGSPLNRGWALSIRGKAAAGPRIIERGSCHSVGLTAERWLRKAARDPRRGTQSGHVRASHGPVETVRQVALPGWTVPRGGQMEEAKWAKNGAEEWRVQSILIEVGWRGVMSQIPKKCLRAYSDVLLSIMFEQVRYLEYSLI